MKRRIFSMIAALALCLGLLPGTAWAAEEEDGPALQAAGTVTRTERLLLYEMEETVDNTDEGWKWEPSTNTLTLTNCHIKTNTERIIEFLNGPNANLVLNGENSIESGANYNPIIASQSGGMEHLTISGTGSLTINAAAGGAGPYLIGCQSVTVEDGVTIQSNIDVSIINKDFTMNGGTIILKGEYVNYGIYVNTGSVIIYGGYLEIKAAMVGMFFPGPSGKINNVKISGGTVNIDAPVSAIHINHSNNNPTGTEQIEITGGEVNLTANGRAFQGDTIIVGENAKLNVQVKGGDGLQVIEGRTVKLAAGTYTGSTYAFNITAEDTTLADLLEEGYAFYKGSVSQANLVTDTTGKTLTGTIVVAKCVHTPLTSNGNGTHGGECTACGQKFEDTPCEYKFTTSGNVHTGACSVCGSTAKITATGTDGLVYNGEEQLPTVSVTLDDKELTKGTDYTVTVSGKAGNVTAKIEGTGDYQFTKELTYTIAPKPLTVKSVTATTRAYDGTNEVAITDVELDGVVTGDTVSVNTTGLKGTIPGTNVRSYTSVTLPTLTLTGAQAGNYTFTQPTGAVNTNVEITQATYNGEKSAASSAKFGTSGTCDLTALIQGIDGATLGKIAPTDADGIFNGTPSISGNTLSYTLADDDQKVGSEGTITVPVSSTNYGDFDLTVTVTVSDKFVPTLTISPITVTYTGGAVPDTAIKGTATVNGQTIPGTWSFDGTPPKNVADSGAKKVVFTPDEEHTTEYAGAEGMVTVTINKAAPSGTPTYIAISASGKTLDNAGLTAPESWPAGTLSWELDGNTEVTANTAYKWTFTPNDTANYETISGTITLWKRSAGGDGGYVPSGPSTSTSTLPVTTTGQNSSAVPTTTTATPTASTQGGTATTTVDTAMGNEIVKQAVANKSEEVVIAPKVTGSATKAEVSIPAATVGQIGSQTNASLIIVTPVADVTIPNGGLGSLSGTSGTVTVTAEKTGSTVELSVTAGGRTVTNVPGGLTLTVPMSYTAPSTVAVLVHDNGTREVVRKSVANNGSVTIPLDGSAKLEIVDNSKYFADVPSTSWAADAVAFASAHELFNGTGADHFSPNLPMSRGMLATVLHNLESNPYQPITGVFTDVNSGAWYAEGVTWAAANGIVTGYGNGQFGPNDNITREQLAVMLWRYAGSPAAANRELHFTDAYLASDWALEALRWATQNGIINGKGNGILDPIGQATRAETAQMLKNYMNQ